MASDNSLVFVPEDITDPNSLVAHYFAQQGSNFVEEQTPWYRRVHYKDPYDPNVVSFNSSTPDLHMIDSDPNGIKTPEFGRSIGKSYTSQTILSLNLIGGKPVSYEWLEKRPDGRELLAIASRNREGRKRDFFEAVTDWSVSDAPFMSLIGNSEGSIARAVQLSDTYKKLQNGDPVTDDEALMATLALAKAQRAEHGTWGAMVGDLMRAAPGFMVEFALTEGVGAAIRTGAAKAAKTGIHLSMARAAKNLTDELIEVEMKHLGAKAAEKASRDQVVNAVASTVYNNTMKGNRLYAGLSEAQLMEMATRRAAYSHGKYLARTQGGKVANGLYKFGQYLQRHASQGLMDFGTWGSAESTIAFSSHTSAGRALADAIGAFTVEPVIHGSLLMAPNQFIVRPIVAATAGQDGRTVSSSQLALQQSALLTENRALMDSAASISLGQNLLEYVSESAGRGFTPLLQSIGLGIDKVTTKVAGSTVPRLVAPSVKVVHTGVNGRLISPDTGVTVGGILRKWVDDVVGTADDFKRKIGDRKAEIVSEALGASTPAERQAVSAMVLSGSTNGLSPEMAAKVGDDVGKFIDDAMLKAYGGEKQSRYTRAYMTYALAEWMNKHNISPQSVMHLFRTMGYDGILGEMFEERYSDVAKGLLGWDERSEDDKGFFKNLAQAAKNVVPEGGFPQLLAEAVGFSMPMLTRALTMRAMSAVGGGGKIADVKQKLEAIADGFRFDETIEMKASTFFKIRDAQYDADNEAIKNTERELNAARSRETVDETVVAGLEANLKQLKLVAERRKERYDLTTKSAEESIRTAAEDNVADMVDPLINVQFWSDQTLTSDDYNKFKSYSESEVAKGAAARAAMVDYAPELAKLLDEYESAFEGENIPWYRTVAQKLIGFTGGLLTGDFSLMSDNPIQWHAQDYRLTKDILNELKRERRKEYVRQEELLKEGARRAPRENARIKAEAENAELDLAEKTMDAMVPTEDAPAPTEEEMSAAEQRLADAEKRLAEVRPFERGSTFAVSKDAITAATDKAFAPRARQIMAAYLQAKQFRSFSQEKMKAQAIEHVAAENGFTFTIETDERGLRNPVFKKVNESGEFVGDAVTAETIYERYKDDVDRVQEEITMATVDLMTTKSTRRGDVRQKLLALSRMPKNYSGISNAIYETAMSMIGRGDREVAYQITRDGAPLHAQLEGVSSKVNMDVVAYIARFENPEDPNLDTRAYEAVAYALGDYVFDGSEASLIKRNREIHRLARIANAVDNKDVVFFSGSTAKIDNHDPRINSGNVFLVKAVLKDGAYVVTEGVNPETGEPIQSSYASYDELVDAMEKINCVRVPHRFLFTRARTFEFSDMYTALRELNLIPKYKERCSRTNMHPMLEKNEDGTYRYMNEDAAYEEFERLRALASQWNDQLKEAPRDAENAGEIEDAWHRLYDPKTGFVTIGEALLRERGVVVDALDKYAGVFVPYKRPRYVLSANVMRGSTMRPEMIIPVQLGLGVDHTTALLNAHVMDAYAKHPKLLRDVLNGQLSDFVRQFSAVIDLAMMSEPAKADKSLMEELKTLQRLCCSGVDVYSRQAKTLRRGNGLTPQAFTVLGVQFGLRRAGKSYGSTLSRAAAFIAESVYRLPSYIPFMNVVDMTLGGNGFLNEIIAHSAKKEEALESQRGIRALLATVEGDSKAFRTAFSASLPLGMTYDQFVSRAQENYTSLHRSGVPTAHSEAAEIANEVARATQRVVTPGEKLTDDQKRDLTDENGNMVPENVVGQAVLRSENQSAHDEAVLKESQDEFGKIDELSRLRNKLDAAKEQLASFMRTSSSDKETIRTQAARIAELENQVADLTREVGPAVKSTLEGVSPVVAIREDQTATDAGNSQRLNINPQTPKTNNVTEDSEGVTEDSVRPTTVDDYDDVYGDEILGAVGSDDFMLDLPSVFEKVVDDGETSVLFGAQQSEGRELTKRQAELAVNLGVRLTLATAGSTAPTDSQDFISQRFTEEVFLDTVKKVLPGLSASDMVAVLTEFRALQAEMLKENLKFTDVAQVTGDLWTDEEREEDDTASDKFNEKSVAQYESAELQDFLALAQRVSPETGRNFQAFIGNIREAIRWLKPFVHKTVDENPEQSDLQTSTPAVDFLYTFLNPRGDMRGKNMTERLALFEHTLRMFDDPTALGTLQGHVRSLVKGGRQGRALSTKGAFLLTYLMALKPNARNSFAVLLSNSVVSSAVRVRESVEKVPGKQGEMRTVQKFTPYVRPAERIGESVIVNSFPGIIGKTRAEVAKLAQDLRAKFEQIKPKLITLRNHGTVEVLRHNGEKIAFALSDVIGTESPLFSALRSERLSRYLAGVTRSGDKAGLGNLAKSLTDWTGPKGEKYLKNMTDVKSGKPWSGIEFADIIIGTLEVISGAAKGTGRDRDPSALVTEGDVSAYFTAAFMTGNPLLGATSRATNTPAITSPLMTLMAFYDASLPETVVRADYDPDRSKKVSSVAVASRGSIPLGNRFIDTKYDELCKKYFPDATAEEIAECKADLTWPDALRTPVFAKSLTRHLTVAETVDVCAASYADLKSPNPWWVPVYAGDHASSVMIQLPAEARQWEDFIEDSSTQITYEKAANKISKWLGLDLLGADAKRSAISSLECQGASMVGVESLDGDTPKFGSNRLVIVENITAGAGGKNLYSNEELKGTTLMAGYGVRQLKSMAKDPLSSMLKVHLINAQGRELSFIKSLSIATDEKTGKFAEGSTLRVLSDFLDKFVKGSRGSSAILTDRDSAKIGPAVTMRYATSEDGTAQSLMDIIFDVVKKVHKEDSNASLNFDTAGIEALVGKLYDTVTGEEVKLSELLPGIQVDQVEDLAGTASIALSYQEDGMIAYPVANVSHDSMEPKEAGRTPRNHEIDAFTMVSVLAEDTKSPALRNYLYNFIANWGLAASATVNDDAFRYALLHSSEAIRELRRHGENINGQNIREELVRMVNARLRQHLNVPLNAFDAALVSSGALVGKDGEVKDHCKSAMRRAMHQGSYIFTAGEAEFYGVPRRVAFCNANVRASGFRYSWYLDGAAFTKAKWAWDKGYFKGVTGDPSDQDCLIALERMFTELRTQENKAKTTKGPEATKAAGDAREIRRHLGTIFKDHHGVHLIDRETVQDHKIRKTGEPYLYQCAFEDLFRRDSNGNMVFDRSAVNIDSDRMVDNEGVPSIVLGGTMMGLPRTPSYNGSMWLQVVRAGLPVTEVENTITLADGSTKTIYTVGYDSCVEPDPWSLEILGCDHDGDKTKLYFLHGNGAGGVDFSEPPAFGGKPTDFAANASVRASYRQQMIDQGMMARKYVDADGRVHEVDPADTETYENEFYDISEKTRKQVSNSFVRTLFDMAYQLPLYDANGVSRVSATQRVPFGGCAVSRSTGPTSCVGGKTNMKKLLNAPNVPEGFLRDKNGNVKSTIDNLSTMTAVSDGASDASNARANIVSIMKDLHLMWATGLFTGDGKLFNTEGSAREWFNFCYHCDGISNSTFDDMKEQICSRLRWRSGMIDVLMTDIIRNRKDDGTRGGLPTTDEEFVKVLSAYSTDANTKGSARWWMDMSTDPAAPAHGEIESKFGTVIRGQLRVTSASVMKALGVKSTGKDKWSTDGTAETFMQKVGHWLVKNGLGNAIGEACRGRGVNYMLGYLTHLSEVAEKTPEELNKALKEFTGWFEVKQQLSEARDFVKSFNYLNVDVGNDVESGTRDRASENFSKIFEFDTKNTAVVPAITKMHAGMMAAYDAGVGLVTTAARGILASSRFRENLGNLLLDPSLHGVLAKSFLLDRIEPFPGNKLQLQGNVQQVPYVLAALSALPTVDGSPVKGAEGMFKFLQALASRPSDGSTEDTSNDKVFVLRHVIESAFDLMYRIATSSDEHRIDNNAFSYFGTAADTAYTTGTYGEVGGGLRRIMPKLRANDETSAQELREKVDRIIRGESFSKVPSNKIGYPLRYESFSLNVKTIAKLIEENQGDELVKKEARNVLIAMKNCMDIFGENFEITPAMMFGQLLPMYSVLNTRTVGAPKPTGTSLFAALPLRIYQAISDEQTRNDFADRDLVNLLTALNWAPRRRTDKKTFTTGDEEGIRRWLKSLSDDGNLEIKNDDQLQKIYNQIRGGVDLNDYRGNPEYRNMFDLFAGDGIVLGAVRALKRAREAVRRPTDEPSAGAIVTGQAAPSDPKVNAEYKKEVAMFASALGALTGTWTQVDYKGGNSFTLSGALRGDLGTNRNVAIVVSFDDQDQVNSEADVRRLASSTTFAASFCAVSGYTVDGKPLTVEMFMSLPLSVREAIVKRYQIGAATANRVEWTIDGKGVATLVGAIKLKGTKGSTKIYHEYFHQMMRMFEALDVFGTNDYEVFKKTFGEAPKGKTWKFNEEAAAEAFRKWVVSRTEVRNTSTKNQAQYEAAHGVFRRIYNLLRRLLGQIKNFFSYSDFVRPETTLFSMMIHGVVQSSGSAREEAEADRVLRNANPNDVRLASAIRERSEAMLNTEVYEDEANPGNRYRYSREDIARLFPEMVDETGALNKEGERLFLAQSRPVTKMSQKIARQNAVSFISARELEYMKTEVERTLDRALNTIQTRGVKEAGSDILPFDEALTDAIAEGSVEEALAADATEQVNRLAPEAEAAEREALADLAGGRDAAQSVEKLLTLRMEMAKAAGYDYSTDFANETTVNARSSDEVDLTVVPGTEEYTKAEVKTAIDAATVAKDTAIDASDISVSSRIGSAIMKALENNLVMEGSWQTDLEDTLKLLGKPKSTDSALDRDVVYATIRNVLSVVNPEALETLQRKDIEESYVFEAMLRVHQRLGAQAAHDASAPGTGLRNTTHSTRFTLGAWLFSTRFATPQAVAHHALEAMDQLVRTTNLQGAAREELELQYNNLAELVHTLDDPTGLIRFSTRGLDELIDRAISYARAGMVPVDRPDDSTDESDGFNEDGTYKDVKIVNNPAEGLSSDRAADLRKLLDSDGNIPADLQSAYKIVKTAAQHLAAMVKFYQQTETIAPTAADIEYANTKAKAAYAKHIDDATWLASQSIGDSMLTDNSNLIEYYDQSYFIANNPDAYMANLVRKTFGGASVVDAHDVSRDFGAIKSEILNLENFYAHLMGLNVEEGGELLKLIYQDRDFSFKFGEIVHEALKGEKRIKFDNYHRIGCGVVFDQEDLRITDLYLKMVAAFAQRQRGLVTGVHNVGFHKGMSVDESNYSKEAIEKRVEDLAKGGKPLNKFELALARMHYQIPESILFGRTDFYNKFVSTACKLMKDARTIEATVQRKLDSGEKITGVFDFNTFVLRGMSRAGLLVAQENPARKAYDGFPMLKTGAVTLSCDMINEAFEKSAAYDKLVKQAGRPPELLKRENIKKAFMSVYRKMANLAKKHAWLTEGDGKFLNNFGTALPFFRGSGVFMYCANRVQREAKRSFNASLQKYEDRFVQWVTNAKAEEGFVQTTTDGHRDGLIMLDMLADFYKLPEHNVALLEAIKNGKYTKENDYGLVLSPDCTCGDIADAIYSKIMEFAELELVGDEAGSKGRNKQIVGEKLAQAYMEHRGVGGDMFGGHTGLNDEQMFRLHGVLPANEQIGHKVHKAIDGITNAIVQRGTLATMLMTPAGDGTPVYYARPDDLAVEASGLPPSFWEQIARWWGEINGFEYDETLSGVQNAQKMYDLIEKHSKENKGYVHLKGNGDDDRISHKYLQLASGESDLTSVGNWLVQSDENLGRDSSLLNGIVGGEAMGYLKQFVQASRVLGFGGAKTRATLHRALSWSKTMSVSFSFFFPIATKWESPVGAVGFMATLMSNTLPFSRKSVTEWARQHPEVASFFQRPFSKAGWITKDFLGFSDIVEMMDSNDPFLAELISWAEALGVKISDRFVNPVEPTKSLVEHDLRKLKEIIRAHWGSKAAARFGRMTATMFSRPGEKAFSYALNATKLATVAQLYLKLKHEAELRGKAFDPIRDLRQYSGYINAEVGGIDPLKYAWTHPRARGILNSLFFSWEWTRGAWEAGGGNILEDFLLGGKSITKEERNFMFGRWVRMYLEVMIGVPMMLQLLAYGMSRAFGDDDDDENDTPFTWKNEDKTRLTAADLTPILKQIGRADLWGVTKAFGVENIAELKKAHPFLLSWLPAYTGTDSANAKTRNRRIYLHFGKQGWEWLRWFDSPGTQLFSKLAMPWQRISEGVIGRNMSYLDRALPWEDKGAFERWLDPSLDGALANILMAFVPFSASGLIRTSDAGAIPLVGPVQYGASYTNIHDRMMEAVEAYARNDRKFYDTGYKRDAKRKRWMRNMLTDVIHDARVNGIVDKDIDNMIGTAAGRVTNKLYGEYFNAFPENPGDGFSSAKLNRIARMINRAGAKPKDIRSAIKQRLESSHREWSLLTPQQREMYRTVIRGAAASPYNNTRREMEMKAAQEASYDY